MNIVTNSIQKVRNSTNGQQELARIRTHMQRSVAAMGHSPESIGERLEELDREWDTDRALGAVGASLTLAGIGLALARDRRFLALPAVVSGFLMQHALTGWCPPLLAVRKMGFRTMREIDEERHALKAMRGDYRDVDPMRPITALDASLRGLPETGSQSRSQMQTDGFGTSGSRSI